MGFSPASEEQLTVSLKPYTYEFQVENFFVCDTLLGNGVWGGSTGHFLFFILGASGGFFGYTGATAHAVNSRCLSSWWCCVLPGMHLLLTVLVICDLDPCPPHGLILIVWGYMLEPFHLHLEFLLPGPAFKHKTGSSQRKLLLSHTPPLVYTGLVEFG